MPVRITLLIFFALIILDSVGQIRIKRNSADNHVSYVIVQGDTVNGEVEYAKRLFGGVLNLIEFTDEAGAAHRYRASDIDGFSISGQEYVSMQFEGYHYFFRPAIQGRFSLYYLERHYHRRHSAQKGVSRNPDEGKELRVFVGKGDALTRLYRWGFREQLRNLTAREGIDPKVFEDPTLELAGIEDFFYTYLAE